MEIDQKELYAILNYNAETGIFRWRIYRAPKARIGYIAGSLDTKGHRQIEIHGKPYAAHRLAWFYVTGEWPKQQIDHINGMKDDNRFSNLREASNGENQRNRGKQRNNTTGYKRVHWRKDIKKFVAAIKHNGKQRHLGFFDTAEEASIAYETAAKLLHGEFYHR